MILDRLDLGPHEFMEATGWEIKPQGACKGDICVPLPEGGFDLLGTADRLGMAVVSEPDLDLWVLGPETTSGRALVSADASDFVLPDLDGNEFAIRTLSGQKVLVAAWAPY